MKSKFILIVIVALVMLACKEEGGVQIRVPSIIIQKQKKMMNRVPTTVERYTGLRP